MSDRTSLILVPGLSCGDDLWMHQRIHLADCADIRIADVTRRDTVAGMAEDVLVDAPPAFALAGLSMGGYVVHAIMAMAPERVTRLALLDTSAVADSPEATERRRTLIEMSKVGRFRGVTDRLLPMLVHADRLSDSLLTDRVKAMVEHIGPKHLPDNSWRPWGDPTGASSAAAIAFRHSSCAVARIRRRRLRCMRRWPA